MRHRYDPAADAAYIYLTAEIGRGEVATTRIPDLPLKGSNVAFDFDAHGHLLGIEILGVSKLLTPTGIELLGAALNQPADRQASDS